MTDDPAEALRARIAQLRQQIDALAGELDRAERALSILTGSQRYVKRESMIDNVRVRHSKGNQRKADQDGRPKSRIVEIANAAGYSLHMLGEQPGVECTASMLSQAAAGVCGMSAERAAVIEGLTKSAAYPRGIEASKSFWPQLRPAKRQA